MMICAADFAELFPDQFENKTPRPRQRLQGTGAASPGERRAGGPAAIAAARLHGLPDARAAGMTFALLPFMSPYNAALALLSTYGEMAEGWRTVATAGERGQPAARPRAAPSDGGCRPQPGAVAEARQAEWGNIVRRTAA